MEIGDSLKIRGQRFQVFTNAIPDDEEQKLAALELPRHRIDKRGGVDRVALLSNLFQNARRLGGSGLLHGLIEGSEAPSREVFGVFHDLSHHFAPGFRIVPELRFYQGQVTPWRNVECIKVAGRG